MSAGETPIDDHRLDRIGQPEQTQRIRDRGTAPADARSHLLLREIVVVDQLCEARGLFESVEVFSLKVLDDRHFERGAIALVTHDRLDRRTL